MSGRKTILLINILQQLIDIIFAHGYLSQPQASYIDKSTMTSYITTVNADNLFSGYKWNDNPQANSKEYQRLLKTGAINQLKDFVDKYVYECPKNTLNNVIDASGLTSMKWQNDEYKEGFIASHTGPCEVWLDEKIKVFDNVDCAANYKSYPAEIPIDYSKCASGQCLFSFYWMALHEPNWQLYKACVKISVSGSSKKSQSSETPQIQPSKVVSGDVYDANILKKFNCSIE